MVVNSKDSAGSGRDRPASTVASKPSTSILAKAGCPCSAISASSVVQGTSTCVSQTWPSQPPAPSAAATKSREAVVTVGLAELTRSVTVPALLPAGRLEQRHAVVAGIDRPDGARAQRLRLQRHHARAEPAEAAGAVADMGADVEGEVARAQEAGVQRIHRRIPRRVAIVDVERATQRGECRVGSRCDIVELTTLPLRILVPAIAQSLSPISGVF